MDKLVNQVEQWSKDKGLDQAEPTKQFLKVSEEFGEIGAALARGDEELFQDAVGDTVVTLIILAQQKGYTFEECLQVAYDEIAGRQGRLVGGIFIKEEDFESN
ncbi:MAG: MazG-like family protein [Tetragenococcus halophilus]|nr:MazG-like family protein [Tetragenococcus halophilus]